MQLSIWEKESFYAPRDVVIVGAGLSGLWSAYYIKQKAPQLSVLVVDRGLIPTGASTRNAGFACFGSVTELWHDLQTMGEADMLQLVEMRYRGLERIQQVLNPSYIDFERCGGYELITAREAGTPGELDEQVQELNRLLGSFLPGKPAFSIANDKIPAMGFQGLTHLIENQYEGALHAGKLCQALLQLVQSLGVSVLQAVEITGYNATASGVQLHTNQHITLQTKRLLVCTNAFAGQLLPSLDIVPARGQVLLTAPIDNLPFKGTFHFEEGFYYFRNLGNRVLLGGARNKATETEATTDMITSHLIQQTLEEFLATAILPGRSYTITDRWSGIMAMGSRKSPLIEAVAPNVFCLARMSGMGVALSPIAGELAADLVVN